MSSNVNISSGNLSSPFEWYTNRIIKLVLRIQWIRNSESPGVWETAATFFTRLEIQNSLTQLSTHPNDWLMLSTTPKGPFYLNHPVVHRQGGADHVDIRCGCRPLPLGERTFRGGAGGVECESVGCGVSVLGTRRQAERKVHGWHSGLWNGKSFDYLLH